MNTTLYLQRTDEHGKPLPDPISLEELAASLAMGRDATKPTRGRAKKAAAPVEQAEPVAQVIPRASLDPIIQAYVEDDLTVAEIAAMGFDEATVRRTVRMIDRNEYKRRQTPPGVKITPRAFGRDRRLPLAARLSE